MTFSLSRCFVFSEPPHEPKNHPPLDNFVKLHHIYSLQLFHPPPLSFSMKKLRRLKWVNHFRWHRRTLLLSFSHDFSSSFLPLSLSPKTLFNLDYSAFSTPDLYFLVEKKRKSLLQSHYRLSDSQHLLKIPLNFQFNIDFCFVRSSEIKLYLCFALSFLPLPLQFRNFLPVRWM